MAWFGMMEFWKDGILEWCNDGILCLNAGSYSIIPPFHPSIGALVKTRGRSVSLLPKIYAITIRFRIRPDFVFL